MDFLNFAGNTKNSDLTIYVSMNLKKKPKQRSKAVFCLIRNLKDVNNMTFIEKDVLWDLVKVIEGFYCW